MANNWPSAAVTTISPSIVPSSVDHLRLNKIDASFVRKFLRKYGQYIAEIEERAGRLYDNAFLATEPIRPVNLKFCFDPNNLESAAELGLMPGVSDVASRTQDVHRFF